MQVETFPWNVPEWWMVSEEHQGFVSQKGRDANGRGLLSNSWKAAMKSGSRPAAPAFSKWGSTLIIHSAVAWATLSFVKYYFYRELRCFVFIIVLFGVPPGELALVVENGWFCFLMRCMLILCCILWSKRNGDRLIYDWLKCLFKSSLFRSTLKPKFNPLCARGVLLKLNATYELTWAEIIFRIVRIMRCIPRVPQDLWETQIKD